MSLQFTWFATLTALPAAHPSQRSNDKEPKTVPVTFLNEATRSRNLIVTDHGAFCQILEGSSINEGSVRPQLLR